MSENKIICPILHKQLFDFAMTTTQSDYLSFVMMPLMESNAEKLKADIEKIERENPELVKAINDNAYLIAGAVQIANQLEKNQ